MQRSNPCLYFEWWSVCFCTLYSRNNNNKYLGRAEFGLSERGHSCHWIIWEIVCCYRGQQITWITHFIISMSLIPSFLLCRVHRTLISCEIVYPRKLRHGLLTEHYLTKLRAYFISCSYITNTYIQMYVCIFRKTLAHEILCEYIIYISSRNWNIYY